MSRILEKYRDSFFTAPLVPLAMYEGFLERISGPDDPLHITANGVLVENLGGRSFVRIKLSMLQKLRELLGEHTSLNELGAKMPELPQNFLYDVPSEVESALADITIDLRDHAARVFLSFLPSDEVEALHQEAQRAPIAEMRQPEYLVVDYFFPQEEDVVWHALKRELLSISSKMKVPSFQSSKTWASAYTASIMLYGELRQHVHSIVVDLDSLPGLAWLDGEAEAIVRVIEEFGSCPTIGELNLKLISSDGIEESPDAVALANGMIRLAAFWACQNDEVCRALLEKDTQTYQEMILAIIDGRGSIG